MLILNSVFAFPFWKLREIESQWLTNIDKPKENVNFALCENLFFWAQKENFYFVAPYVRSI